MLETAERRSGQLKSEADVEGLSNKASASQSKSAHKKGGKEN